jgi:hypothetical protein
MTHLAVTRPLVQQLKVAQTVALGRIAVVGVHLIEVRWFMTLFA